MAPKLTKMAALAKKVTGNSGRTVVPQLDFEDLVRMQAAAKAHGQQVRDVGRASLLCHLLQLIVERSLRKTLLHLPVIL